jgi:hypothetical protein
MASTAVLPADRASHSASLGWRLADFETLLTRHAGSASLQQWGQLRDYTVNLRAPAAKVQDVGSSRSTGASRYPAAHVS